MDRVNPLHLLIIEEDANLRVNLPDMLERDDHRVEATGEAPAALARDDWGRTSVIIL